MKKVPDFKNEDEEFEFGSSTGEGADSTKYVDWSKAKRLILVKLKPTLRHLRAPARGHGRRSEDSGQPARRSVPIAAQGVSGRAPRAREGTPPGGVACTPDGPRGLPYVTRIFRNDQPATTSPSRTHTHPNTSPCSV